MNQFDGKSFVNGLAQIPDIHIDNVGAGVEVVTPHLLGQALARQQLIFIAQKIFEQREFAGRERNVFVAAFHRAFEHVHRQLAGLQNRHALDPAAAQNRFNAGRQLAEIKRLHEIIVGANLQAFDAVFHFVACGENQNRRDIRLRAKFFQDFKS